MYLRNFCTENDPCSSSPCQNDGTCSKTSRTTFTCQCAAGYSGTKCGTGKFLFSIGINVT